MEKSIKELAQIALDVQDASNFAGTIHRGNVSAIAPDGIGPGRVGGVM